jgi:hypothetical protein
VSTGCEAYDQLSAGSRPPGPIADYSWHNPYPGVAGDVELFPLALMESPFLRGIGISGGYARGWANASLPGVTATGAPTTVPVSSIDERWWLMPAYRYYFGWGSPQSAFGYVGARLGIMRRGFTPDLPAGVFAPATRRVMGAVGLDLLIPFASWIKLELGGLYYFGAGVSAEDAAQLGRQTSSFGLSAYLGLRGDIGISPVGYYVRGEWARFQDVFGSGGTAWPQGGFAGETYITLGAGLSLSF